MELEKFYKMVLFSDKKKWPMLDYRVNIEKLRKISEIHFYSDIPTYLNFSTSSYFVSHEIELKML